MDYKNFCVLPFINSYEGTQSSYRVCCEFKENAYCNKFADVWNGPYYKNIRNQFNNRQMPAACRVCIDDESLGIDSHRMYSNRKYKDLTEKFYNNPVDEVVAPAVLDLRLTNKCNLECVMCGGLNSSAIDKRVRSWHKSLSIQTTDGRPVRDKNLVQYLKENIKYIQELHFAGGEPFIMKDVVDLLQYCVENDYAKDISIQMTTNVTTARKGWFEKYLLKFKSVKLVCSVDAIGETLEYVRFPSKWSVIERNLLYFKELKNTNNNFHFHLAPAIHIMNFRNFPKLIDFAVENNISIETSIVYSSDSFDTFLMYNKLPKDYRKNIVEQIKERLPAMENIAHNINENLLYRWENDPQEMCSDIEKQNFIDQVEYWDSHKPKFAELYPELCFLIDK